MVDEKSLLDWAARIGVQAKFDGMSRSHLENILSSLEMSSDEKISLLLTVAYAHRQAGRLGRGHDAARLINEALNMIYRGGEGKEQARRMLGVAKWVFETVERVSLPRMDVSKLTFDSYLESLRKIGRGR